jgi:hypothetical protein
LGAGANGATRKAVQAAIDDMKADKSIFVGGVKDNKGNVFPPRPSTFMTAASGATTI